MKKLQILQIMKATIGNALNVVYGMIVVKVHIIVVNVIYALKGMIIIVLGLENALENIIYILFMYLLALYFHFL